MTSAAAPLVCLVVCCTVAGCASSGLLPNTKQATPPRIGADGRYVLSREESTLPCNKLRGRIQLRVAEMRDRNAKPEPSTAARALQWTTNMMPWSTSQPAADNRSRNQRDLAMLNAYNARLGQLGCETYNLKSELSPANEQTWQIR